MTLDVAAGTSRAASADAHVKAFGGGAAVVARVTTIAALRELAHAFHAVPAAAVAVGKATAFPFRNTNAGLIQLEAIGWGGAVGSARDNAGAHAVRSALVVTPTLTLAGDLAGAADTNGFDAAVTARGECAVSVRGAASCRWVFLQ